MSTGDYARGFNDGLRLAEQKQYALNSPDRTKYELIGGPKHGEVIETGGKREFYAMDSVRPDPYQPQPWWHYNSPLNSYTLRYGTYKRETIVARDGTSRTVYVWQGYR